MIFRPPILSPRGHKDYNRFKYYSALKTGFKHMHKEDVLNIPKNMIDEQLFVQDFTFKSTHHDSLISIRAARR